MSTRLTASAAVLAAITILTGCSEEEPVDRDPAFDRTSNSVPSTQPE